MSWLAMGALTCGRPDVDRRLKEAGAAYIRAERDAHDYKDEKAQKAFLGAAEELGLVMQEGNAKPKPVQEDELESDERSGPKTAAYHGIPEETLDALLVKHGVKTGAKSPKGKYDALKRAGFTPTADEAPTKQDGDGELEDKPEGTGDAPEGDEGPKEGSDDPDDAPA